MMRKVLLLMLSAVFAMTMTAANVTPQMALSKATSFLKSRVMNGHGPHMAPGATPQLSLATQMEGLYVFNVAANDGFVIVSGDDRAVPILGYADSGSFDPENIPDNMRAWLQGYADEMASLNSSNAAPAAAPALAPAVAKEPIAPLIQTHWNQHEPYNNLCPLYNSTDRSVTGCVATATAQAMYYTETKADNATTTTTAEIPSYTPSVGAQPAIPAGTVIRWSDMQLSYNGSETDAQKEAVAQIMYWVGVAVQMSYGSTSSSNTVMAANALTSYFGYNTTTTKAVMRSWYSYADWLEILYNELAQERPVIYGGQSSGGGHEFIVDGYQTEDYFHVNWGWGGTSDGYFKLSALNPDEQGIGGSSSTDGYHYGHDAIVGLQKPEGTGTVISPEPLIACEKLTVNSISVSANPVNMFDDVTFTVNITNPTSQDYDGDVYVSAAGIGLLTGNVFHIGAGETKDCVLPWVAKGYSGKATIRVMLPNDIGNYTYYGAWPTTTLTINPVAGSDGVELALTVTTVNAESTGETKTYGSNTIPVYNLYDNNFKATITLTNSSPNNYSGQYTWALAEVGKGYSYSFEEVYVPAGSSKDIVVEVKNLDPDKEYVLMATYVKNSSYSLKYPQYYKLKPVIVAYADDGTKTVTKPSASYTVPANVLSVDLRGAGVTSVTKNSKVNCLYILNESDEVPTGLTNVVKYAGGSFTADAITLQDDNDFYSPVDFTATKVEFTYNNAKQADGANGWNTLMLPFNVTKVTADGTEISWFKSASEKGKNFWLKEFTSDEPGKVYFSYAQDIKANTPYIIALPGNHWGSAWDLSAKAIKFIGEGVEVSKSETHSTVTGSAYRFVGSTKAVSTPNIYAMNAAGNKFDLKATGGSTPFRAFFKADTFDRTVTSLGIGSDDGEITGIEAIENQQQTQNGQVYNLNGQRIMQPQKGIYIQNGKKFIKK